MAKPAGAPHMSLRGNCHLSMRADGGFIVGMLIPKATQEGPKQVDRLGARSQIGVQPDFVSLFGLANDRDRGADQDGTLRKMLTKLKSGQSRTSGSPPGHKANWEAWPP
jgi:hypothetical protein